MKRIRCKFKVTEITLTEKGTNLKAYPVYSDDPDSENKTFWEYTPSGSLEFTCVKGSALEGVAPGQEFYLDLIPTE